MLASFLTKNILNFSKLVKIEFCMAWNYQGDYVKLKD